MSLHDCLWRRAACRQRRSFNSGCCLSRVRLWLRRWAGRRAVAEPRRMAISEKYKALVGAIASTRARGPSAPQRSVRRALVTSVLDEYECDQARAQKCEAYRSQGEKSARDDILMPHTHLLRPMLVRID
jgi:hypothetical protein